MNTVRATTYTSANFILHGVIFLLLVFTLFDHFFELNYETSNLLNLLALAALGVMVLRYKQLLLYGLSFLIPLSLQMKVAGNSQISVPAEVICVLLTVFFSVKVLLGYKPDRKFLVHPITLLILLDLSWLLVTSCASEMPAVSFKRFIIRLIYYISFYYFYYELFKQDRKNIKRIFLLHVVGFLIPIGLVIYQQALMNFSMVGSQRTSAPFYFDHTIFGAGLVIFVPFLIHYSMHSNSLKQTLFYCGLVVIFLLSTWLSYSRAAWVSLGISIIFFSLVKLKIKTKHILMALTFGVIILILSGPKFSSYFADSKQLSHTNDVTMHLKSVSNVNTDASNKERINRWKSALRMFADKPLFGFGPGTYQFFYGPYQHRDELTRISTFSGNKGHAHSEYLNYLSETGLPGLLIFITLVFFIFYRGIRLIRTSDDPTTKDLSLFLTCGLLTFFIHAFFNGFLEFDKIAMPVLSSVAAITFLDLQTNSGTEITK
ncbi:MAG: O-antigen ligase family protein [bacterium]|nr:O-antigen ligase family protein [bacterium]